jgi:hypothetical protein
MIQEDIPIKKDPELSDSSNYEFLRQNGMEFIEKLSSDYWTDYNAHDPGITLLELLCYAITDLGYRTSFKIRDLLTGPEEKPDQDPERQGFFSARKILTVNPWTISDYRKLLIDIEGIRNAWLKCKECSCDDLNIYSNCKTSKLQYKETNNPVIIKGLYDIFIEFENIDNSCNFNNGKIRNNFSFQVDDGISTAVIEMRLPEWQKVHKLPEFNGIREKERKIKSIKVQFISGNRTDDKNIPDKDLSKVLKRPVYATIKVDLEPDNDPQTADSLMFTDIALRIWFQKESYQEQISLEKDIFRAIEDTSSTGIFAKYLKMIRNSDEVVRTALDALHNKRNLCEDYCNINAIPVEEIGVCADIDMEPSYDLESVLAEVYYRISQYIDPDIKFHSIKQLMDDGFAVDEILDGPVLKNGFVTNKELENSDLRKFLYTSDIINDLMNIDGVKSVRNFVLTKYDSDGRLIKNEEWVMEVTTDHRAKFYFEASKILVFKNGLPLFPDKLELNDTLQVIKGKYAQPQYVENEEDIQKSFGNYYNFREYFPLQYSLPLTYGVGFEGLSDSASVERKARAKQLKGYLMVFEQLFVNYLEHLANVKELFAIDPAVGKTYFSRIINSEEIAGSDLLINGITEDDLKHLVESSNVFLDRRNRFLDHLLARFAENFADYALMLYSFMNDKPVTQDKLIRDKIRFLKDYPVLSSDRAKAINYKSPEKVCSNENVSGIQERIKRLLGIEDMDNHFELFEEKDVDHITYERRWRLRNESGKIILSSSTRYFNKNVDRSEGKAKNEIDAVKGNICIDARYSIRKVKKWVVNLTDATGETIATRKQAFETRAAAEEAKREIIEYGKKLITEDKIFVVEHLLLRPRNGPAPPYPKGDSLLSICVPEDCSKCADNDPYSFRLTFVFSGESGIAARGLVFRRFAEQTIRQEIPAHIGIKVCWVSNDQLLRFEKLYCAWLKDMANHEPDKKALHDKLDDLLKEFNKLKSVYPDAKLFDCRESDNANRVTLDQTVI